MCLSAAPWTASCGPTDWSSLFPSQRGTQKPGWAQAWTWASRRPGQMGQQMGKEAEPPLICSTENTVWPHPGRKREESRKTQQKKTEGQNTRGGPETLMLSSHNNLIYFYLQQSSQEEQEVYGQSSKKTGGLVTQCLALLFNLMYINKLILYLPSLISSMNASPAFFWIEFCHSWRERKNIYYSHKDCPCI